MHARVADNYERIRRENKFINVHLRHICSRIFNFQKLILTCVLLLENFIY